MINILRPQGGGLDSPFSDLAPYGKNVVKNQFQPQKSRKMHFCGLFEVNSISAHHRLTSYLVTYYRFVVQMYSLTLVNL